MMNSLQQSNIEPMDSDRIQQAQRFVGIAMVSCLSLWFLPVVSGAACSAIESTLIHKIMKTMDCHSEANVEKVYWFFRRKTFFLFGGTYMPFAGIPIQLFETYGLGQFAIYCSLKPELLNNEDWLERSWIAVSPDIFSGEHVIQSYEQFTGKIFPIYARQNFTAVVDGINRLYLFSQNLPGAARIQDVAGKATQQTLQASKNAVTYVGGTTMREMRKVATHTNQTLDKRLNSLADRLAVRRQALEAKLDSNKKQP